MPDRDIVVVGASAGGVEALVGLAASLPADLPAAVFVVLHLPATGTSALPDILSRHGPLAATHVKDGEPIENGRIYVAPPDHHLLLRTGYLRLSRGPRENGHRPAVDTLFRSAARE
jgi:two-component system, chemotaxis family, protein-glutamate methylesterase/glutaminase